MQIYKSANNSKPSTKSTLKYPFIVLSPNSWDDFWAENVVCSVLLEAADTTPIKLGDVKILNVEAEDKQISDAFPFLDKIFVSLGQDLDYYKNVRNRLISKASKYLDAINDLVQKPLLQDIVETKSGFRNSLIRFNDAIIALRDGASILDGLNASPKDGLINSSPHRVAES